MSLDPSPPLVRLVRDNHATVLLLGGDWLVGRSAYPALPNLEGVEAQLNELTVRLDTQRWDSALPAFLTAFSRLAAHHGLRLNFSNLPPTLRTLVELPALGNVPAPSPKLQVSWLEQVGRWARGQATNGQAWLGFIGQVVERTVAVAAGRVRSRPADWCRLLDSASAKALPIVALVNILVGAVLAFVGAVQLQRFGAEIFVANLIGISVAREMAAVMTAIVLAGRTGAAYAAEIATMHANEEIDALAVLGLSKIDFLVLPRVITLVVLSPFLYLYATGFGLLGGLATAITVLDLTPAAYIQQTLKAVEPVNFLIGGLKSAVFGASIAMIGCRIGLASGRSSADVGQAATRAAVAGIVAVISLDAVFAVCANALGV